MNRSAQINVVNRSSQVSPVRVTKIVRSIRAALLLVMAGLLVSGITAFPLLRETRGLLDLLAHSSLLGPGTPLFDWLLQVHTALVETVATSPFLAYGSDWLAFAHIVFALVFIGPLREPVRNQWVVTFGLIACIGVLPLALVAGAVRDVPLFWRLIDCSFAILCAIPLMLCRHYIHLLEHLDHAAEHQRTRRQQHRRLRRRAGLPKPIV